ncbi:hypothetical protein [Sphingomonas sp. G-3-2-10]|uniref:hypothetical protein n=1 Tax=Sphingomonas sp. G-3-2-10 TaxID=2728838 RepID=UPI00146B8BD3|nr:hypothetical protein [Sphingomonas sp. G-3-2-10]NML07174.1 hypothetical protein [Sphingomonas sp. G-3-2-10]
MSDDPFETVVIAYSQSQAGVILSLFEWNGIPAYAMNIEMARNSAPLTLALGGIPIRVAREAAAEAREILGEAADASAEAEVPRLEAGERAGNFLIGLLCFLFAGAAPPPRIAASIVKG